MSMKFLRVAVAAALLLQPSLLAAADNTPSGGYAGAAVTVIKAKKTCFADTIAVSGVLVPRDEVAVRPDREGLQISQVLVDSGEIVNSGQALVRLVSPDASSNAPATTVQSPVAGIILKANAAIGTMASPRAPPLFQIIAQGEFELLAEVPAKQLSKLGAGQVVKITVVGRRRGVGPGPAGRSDHRWGQAARAG